MPDYKKISKQIGVSYFIQGLSFFTNFFLFMILTRMLTKSDYGIYTILIATFAMLSRILLLGLHSFIIRDIAGRQFKEKKRRISIILNFVTITLAVFLFFSYAIKKSLLEYFRLSTHDLLFQIVILLVFLAVLMKLIASYLVANKKIIESRILSFLAIESWGLLIIFYGLYKRGLTINEVFYLRILVALLIFIASFVYLFKNKVWKINLKTFDKKYIKNALKFSVPIMLVGAISWIITASDRYILGFFHGSVKVALYSYSYSLFSFVLTAGMIISSTLLPYIAEAWNKKMKEKANFLFNASIKYTLTLVLPAIFGLLVMKKEIATMISGTKYLSALPIIPILMFFPLIHLVNIIYQQALLLKNKTRVIGLIYLIGLITNIILNFLLIPPFHFYGASIATILTYILMFGLFYRKCRTLIKLDNKYIRTWRIVLSTLLMSLLLYFTHPTVIYTKLLVICLGAAFYFIILFSLGGFVKEEIDLLRKIIKRKIPLKDYF